MYKPSRSSVEKRIGQVSSMDRIVRVHAQVFRVNPFIISDGSGRALVKSTCAFKEGDKVRVIGYVSIKENGNLPEIDPIAIQDMNEFDFDLYVEMQQTKNRLNTGDRHEK